jgi:hypothetical protein
LIGLKRIFEEEGDGPLRHKGTKKHKGGRNRTIEQGILNEGRYGATKAPRHEGAGRRKNVEYRRGVVGNSFYTVNIS